MKKIKHMLANWILSDVLKCPEVKEVFKDLTPEKKAENAIEAQKMLDSNFYMEFINLIEQNAISKMSREASTSDDMLFGKALIYYVSLQRMKMKEFASYKPPKEGEPTKW